MTPYESNTTLREIADLLCGDERIALTTHAKPDGDALGAVTALARALAHRGKAVEQWIMPPVMRNLRMLLEDGPPVRYREEEDDPLPETEPDRIVVVDTGAWSQLKPMRCWIEPRREKTVVIDHHLRGDDVGKWRYIDAAAASTCELVAELIDRLGVPYDPAMRASLYVGVATDTGWFRFSNTRAETHELAARLLREGVNHAELYARLEQGERPEKLQLIIRALESLKTIADGHAAVMTLRSSDFDETGAREEETERLVDIPQLVADVRVVVLLTETPEGEVKMSFRSKPGEGAVDVNALARRFGGGGHARAAGARSNEPFETVRQQLEDVLEEIVPR